MLSDFYPTYPDIRFWSTFSSQQSLKVFPKICLNGKAVIPFFLLKYFNILAKVSSYSQLCLFPKKFWPSQGQLLFILVIKTLSRNIVLKSSKRLASTANDIFSSNLWTLPHETKLGVENWERTIRFIANY